MSVRERYTPVTVPVNSTVKFTSNSVGGFLAITSGTVTITDGDGDTVVDGLPVTAGVFHSIPFFIKNQAASVTTSNGASGVLGK